MTTSEFTIAVHALVFLNHKGTTVTSEELAANICTNSARVRKVLAPLKKAGLVKTKEGSAGGYYFPHAAAHVNLQQVSQALGSHFVTANWLSGDLKLDCLIASGMAGIMSDLYGQLDQLCQDRLALITLQEIEDLIFDPGHTSPFLRILL